MNGRHLIKINDSHILNISCDLDHSQCLSRNRNHRSYYNIFIFNDVGKLNWCRKNNLILLVFNGENLHVIIIKPDDAVSKDTVHYDPKI